MVKWALLFVVSAFVVLGSTLYFKLGGYKVVDIHPPEPFEFEMIYRKHTGAYHKIASVIDQVERWAAINNIACSKTFGEFLDDPNLADEDRLRSHGGCITSGPTEDLPEGYFYKNVPAKTYVTATFDGSPAIGPFKVYPKVDEWMQQNRQKISGPVIEVYTLVGKDKVLTTYYFPIEQPSNL